MKRLLSFVAILLCLCLQFTTAANADYSFNKDAMNSVVLVTEDLALRVFDGNQEYIEPMDSYRGTGFFIGPDGENPQYLVTNYHVVQDVVELRELVNFQDPDTGFIYNGDASRIHIYYEQNIGEEAFVVAYDEDKDLAILRLERPTDRRIPLTIAPPDDEIVGEEVFALGFPGLSDYTVDATSNFDISDLTVTSGVVGRLVTEQGTGRRLLQMNVSISGGNSGGPLVDKNGALVGINAMGSTQTENLNYAISAQELIPLLNNNNVPYSEYAGSNRSVLLWVGLGIAAAAVVVLVIVLIVKKGKNQSSSVPVQPAPASPQPSVSRTPMIRSYSPQHQGKTFPVPPDGMLLGRDSASCQLCFGADTPGVSSRHCSLAWEPDQGCFTLTDVGSTYGTFLESGQKLNSGVPYRLRPGEAFYLGEKGNLIRAELR